MDFIDLFCGIGGFYQALKPLGFTPVFSSDIDPECQKVYKDNYGLSVEGDITKILVENIPKHDLITAGFPCQPFSSAGRRGGFKDPRGTLFFEVLRIAKHHQPKAILLENVKGMIHHDKGQTLSAIVNCLKDIGYFVNYKVLNAKDFQLAQNRERLIIVALKDKLFDFKKVKASSHSVCIGDILEKDVSVDALPEEDYTLLNAKLVKKQKSGLMFCGFRNKKTRVAGVRPGSLHLSRAHKQPNRIYHIKGTHPSLSAQENSGRNFISDGVHVRKLTMKECYRLQGFPDSFKVSEKSTQAYSQIGNTVPVSLIRSVGKTLKEVYIG